MNRNNDVTQFLDALNHPLRKEIEALRIIILSAVSGLTETIKWNGPNYTYEGNDRITLKIQPPRQLQLIFHRGAKVQEPPAERLIKETTGLLVWKENDRAVATFKNKDDIETHEETLRQIIKDWIAATG